MPEIVGRPWQPLLLLAALAFPAWSAADLSGAAGVVYDSNIGNAGSSGDVRTDTIVQGGLAASWHLPGGPSFAAQLRAGLDMEAFTENSDLSEVRSDLRLRVLGRPGKGFYVPILAAWVAAGGRSSASDLRSGGDYRAGAYLSENLTTVLRGRVSAGWSKRDSVSRVYDLEGAEAMLGVDWQVSPRVVLYSELAHYRGGMVASIVGPLTPKSAHLYLESRADAIEADSAYGENWYALRLNSRRNSASLGGNVSIGEGWSVDGQLLYRLASVVDAGGSYDRGQLAFSLLKRF